MASELAVMPMSPVLSEREFRQISDLMHKRFGVDLRNGKEGLVAARLGKKLRTGGFTSYGSYFEHAMADRTGESLIALVDALTTNHTSFLRERAHFDYLISTVLPLIPAPGVFHIWSAACSSGEEPYTLACVLLDALKSIPHLRILATDLSTRVLEKAKLAIYSADRFREFPPAWANRYLVKVPTDPGAFQLSPEVRKTVEFRRLNLMDPISHGRKFHAIFCRNVLMYFDRPTQQSVVGRLSACLEPGGCLFVGHSESLTGIDHPLRQIRPAVYRLESGRRLF